MREFAIKVRFVVDQINYVQADNATEAMRLCREGEIFEQRFDGKGITGYSNWSESSPFTPTFRHIKSGDNR